MPPRTLRPGEIGFALAILVFAAAAFWRSAGISGFANLSGAGVFPMLASGVMIASALFILVDATRRRGPERHDLRAVLRHLLSPRLVAFAILIALYAAAISLVGFVVASAIFVFVSVALLWRRGLARAAAIAIVSVTVLWLVFRIAFQVVLPTGSLW